MSADTSDKVRNALNSVIDLRAKNLFDDAKQEMNDRLKEVAGKVIVQTQQPEVHVHNEVPVPSVDVKNEINVPEIPIHVDVAVDMKPVARALAVLVKGVQEIEERQYKTDRSILGFLKDMAFLQQQNIELQQRNAELQEKSIEAAKELAHELREHRKSKITGKIDRETGKITVERS